jgi:hypothetical protein
MNGSRISFAEMKTLVKISSTKWLRQQNTTTIYCVIRQLVSLITER